MYLYISPYNKVKLLTPWKTRTKNIQRGCFFDGKIEIFAGMSQAQSSSLLWSNEFYIIKINQIRELKSNLHKKYCLITEMTQKEQKKRLSFLLRILTNQNLTPAQSIVDINKKICLRTKVYDLSDQKSS